MCSRVAILVVGFSHPLGMQSGKIKKSELRSYVAADTNLLNKARLFGPEGWRPNDAYLSQQEMPSSWTSMSKILNSPIFFEVNFVRMKKISYFIIQDSALQATHPYTQTFFISYNDGTQKVYGEPDAKVKSSSLLHLQIFYVDQVLATEWGVGVV